MKEIDILVIGAGPAGMHAAISASKLDATVLICERNENLGGQLIKQTGKFFGKEYAGLRGFQIYDKLINHLEKAKNIEIWTSSTIMGRYNDGVVTCLHEGKHVKIKPARTIIATGASEKFLAFSGNDLPGVFSAGAAETLMHMSGIKPAEKVLMVGAGNIGLTVSYQLKQAGVEVAAVIDVLPQISGYFVHASKLKRTGTPIKCSCTILEAYGDEKVEGAKIAMIDENWQIIPGTEENIECDAVCLAVGLNPLAELCWQSGCQMAYIKELSGPVPIVDKYMETTVSGIYAAGDVCGLEEATTAIAEGKLAGISAAASLGYGHKDVPALQKKAQDELDELRAGPMSQKIRIGLEKLADKGGANDATI